MQSHLAVYQRVTIVYGFQMFHVGAFYSTRLVYKVNMPATQKRSHYVRAHPGVIHFCSRVMMRVEKLVAFGQRPHHLPIFSIAISSTQNYTVF